jgi:hypothetical protein
VNQWRRTQRYVPIQRVDEDALTRAVLAQPEMEKRRFPLVKVPPLRVGDF